MTLDLDRLHEHLGNEFEFATGVGGRAEELIVRVVAVRNAADGSPEVRLRGRLPGTDEDTQAVALWLAGTAFVEGVRQGVLLPC